MQTGTFGFKVYTIHRAQVTDCSVFPCKRFQATIRKSFLCLSNFTIEVFSNLNVKHQRLGCATSYRKQQLQSLAAGLYKSFVAVFSGGVLIELNFVILSFDPSSSTEFFYLFP